ncbi:MULTISPECIES: ester cyclase [unclassified Rhodococcus (in: high G+C Gram-positive bacteria)]|uniref:ester cyclase n=1 Tax=unclassified Rhodococcus (in: high G+C Gram-positive bacteria) TaxID=192944 RepID=UPI001C52C196|nr:MULTISPECIES: ester cyclase [unclassified Rhodococcus (in: high G+C Gram-positive bacteria)]
MTENQQFFARGVFRVLETGDVELARAVAAPTFANREAISGPAACARPGPDGLLASSMWMRSAFTDLHFEIVGEAYAGHTAWLELRMQGRHTGPFVQYNDGAAAQVLPPTGRHIDCMYSTSPKTGLSVTEPCVMT